MGCSTSKAVSAAVPFGTSKASGKTLLGCKSVVNDLKVQRAELTSTTDPRTEALRMMQNDSAIDPTAALAQKQDVVFTNAEYFSFIQSIAAVGNIEESKFAAQAAQITSTLPNGRRTTLGDLITLLNSVEVVSGGTVAEGSNHFDDISTPEAMRRMDTDEDGRLSIHELGDSLKISGASDADVATIIEQFDTNKDGVISHDEFQRMVAMLLTKGSFCEPAQKWSQSVVNYPDLVKRSEKWLCEALQETLGAAPSDQTKPKLFVPYGPCGSGKTAATMAALSRYGMRKEDCVELNVDSQVRSYMEKVMQNEDMFGDHDTYGAVRAGWPRRMTHQLLEKAIATRRSLIIETTGRSINLTEKLRYASEMGFTVVIVYPVVPFLKIVPRVMARKKAVGQGYLPLDELALSCRQAARNLAAYKASGGTNCVIWFANNCGPENSEHLVPDGDPELAHMAISEFYQTEVRALLLQHAAGRPYTAEALLADQHKIMDRIICQI